MSLNRSLTTLHTPAALYLTITEGHFHELNIFNSKHTKSDLSKLYKFNIRGKGLAANQEMSAFNISLTYLRPNFFVPVLISLRMSFTAVSRKS